MGKGVIELIPANFESTIHMRTAAVAAAGDAAFSVAAIIRCYGEIPTELPIFGNTTDLAATNGWMLSVDSTGTPERVSVHFKSRTSAPATLDTTVAMPAGYTIGGKPICVIATFTNAAEARLYMNGTQVDSDAVGGNTIVAGLGRLCLGSLPTAAATNTALLAVSSAAYINSDVGLASIPYIMQHMLETGDIPNAADLTLAPAWTHLYSMQQSALRRNMTLPILESTAAAALSSVVIPNLGTAGTAGDLVAFGAPTGLVRVCPVAPGFA